MEPTTWSVPKPRAATIGSPSSAAPRRASALVRPAGSASRAPDRTQDIFIAAGDAGDAATGDTVANRGSEQRRIAAFNPRGKAVSILEAATRTSLSAPTSRMQAWPAWLRVDGMPFSQPILLGDPGAQERARGRQGRDRDGALSHAHAPAEGEGVITEVLGPHGAPGVDTISIIREFNLPEAVRRRRDRGGPCSGRVPSTRAIPQGRTDLTALVTRSRHRSGRRPRFRRCDFGSRGTDKGHWRLGVHIADVAHFVRPKTTARTREAYQRAGTSTYLPDRVIPMLPEIISNGLASLQPDRVRYTKTAFIEFTADGMPVGVTDPMSAAIKKPSPLYPTKRKSMPIWPIPEAWRDREARPRNLYTRLLRRHARPGRHSAPAAISPLRRARADDAGSEKVDLDADGASRQSATWSNKAPRATGSSRTLYALGQRGPWPNCCKWPTCTSLRRVHKAPDPRTAARPLTEFVTGLGFQVESLESRFELQAAVG